MKAMTAGLQLKPMAGEGRATAKTVLWAECAMNVMAQYGLMPTPHNYQLWYVFVSDEGSPLSRELASLIRSRAPITEAVCARLYEKYFGQTAHEALLRETNQRVHSELELVLSKLKTAENDTLKFSDTLSGYSDDIAASQDSAGLRGYVESLLADTRSMEEKTRSLEQELKKSSKEIGHLKHCLEAARLEALTDELTGIGNRKHFDQALQAAINDSNESSEPYKISLIFGDVDYFKTFNDTWGHKLGDHVLKLVAGQLREIVGDRGTPTRYGGEEFAVLLPDSSLEEAVAIAERLRSSIGNKSMKTKNTGVKLGRITMSFGVAEYVPGESQDEFVARADRALYAAKDRGRNRVLSERDVSPDPDAPAAA